MARKGMHFVRRTIVANAVNVAQAGDELHPETVKNLGLVIGDGDDADVLPLDADEPELHTSAPEVRYDKPGIPPAGPLGAGVAVTTAPTVTPPKDPEPEVTEETPAKTTKRAAAKSE